MSSERLPKTDAEAELLKLAISKLLRAIPESWAEFDFDSLTATDDNALFLLVAAGMVERRGWVRSSIANHPTCFEFRFQATGEGGFVEVMDSVCAVEYQTWADSWRAWKSGETGHVSPFRSEVFEPQEWRLTDQGVIARCDLDTTPEVVNDFVLSRGMYGPGYWHRLARSNRQKVAESVSLIRQLSDAYQVDWTNLQRPPVVGAGLLLEIRASCTPPEPQSVNVANWGEGGDVLVEKFSTMLESLFDRMKPNSADNNTNGVAAVSALDHVRSNLSKKSREVFDVVWHDGSIGIRDLAVRAWPDVDGGTGEDNARKALSRLIDTLANQDPTQIDLVEVKGAVVTAHRERLKQPRQK